MKLLTIAETAEVLLQNDNYIMLTHRRPDGDTIGSAAALCGGLRALGKTAAVLENPQFTEKFKPYLEGLTVPTVPENAYLISVDVATEGILAYNAVDYVNQIRLKLDHHARSGGFAELGCVDAGAAACAEIVLALLQQMCAPIEKRTAEALYVGLSTDTGCFRFSNVTSNTLRAAAACIDANADTFAINRVMFLTKRLPRLQLEAHLTQTTEFYAGGKVAVSAIPDALKVELGLTEDDIDDISGFGREIAGVEIAVMLRQEGTRGKISVRTSPDYNASELCARLGGGGHKATAGASVDGGIEAAKAAILDAIADSGVKL